MSLMNRWLVDTVCVFDDERIEIEIYGEWYWFQIVNVGHEQKIYSK